MAVFGQKTEGEDERELQLYQQLISQSRGVKLMVTGGHISLAVEFKGPNVILGMYKCRSC